MTQLYIITDYKDNFSSHFAAKPYRSGLNHKLLEEAFKQYDISIQWLRFSDVDFEANWNGKFVLYTSSEDDKVLYKSYIEDIVYGLELAGAILIPKFKFLRAHHNKVFMEILRNELCPDSGIKSQYFGTLEEMLKSFSDGKISFPCVIKAAAGAMSSCVAKAENLKDLIKKVSSFAVSKNIKLDIKDCLRSYKHKGYIKESTYRNKFIVQPMIKKLDNDWKVLVYGDKIFNIKRYVRKNDFRASGSHVNYKIGSESGLTSEMMDFVYDIYKKLDVPMLSFDLAFDGVRYYMIEFQTLYFGTSTFELCQDYYERHGTEWVLKSKDIDKLENIYAYAIHKYLQDNNLLNTNK